MTTPVEVTRDRWGRPLIIPPDGGKPTAYTRATTFAGSLEDTHGLTKWQVRMTSAGLASRPDLLLSIAAHSDDKKRLDELCAEAREAAAASSAATTGTALHRIAERLDRGQKVDVPAVARADLDAYLMATADLRWLHIEELLVCDELKVAGTPDRVAVVDGRPTIVDLKTGSLDYGMGKIAGQLALYAHSVRYDPVTGERAPLEVDQARALVVHLPAGSGRCELVDVDIAAGWEAVQLAGQVRAWRSRRDLARPHQPADLAARAAGARTVDDLLDLYRTAVEAGAWNDQLRVAFADRKRQLQQSAQAPV